MQKIHKALSSKSFKSGTKIKCDQGNGYEVLSCVDLDWLYKDERKNHFNERYMLSLKFIGNFAPLKKKATTEEEVTTHQ